MTDREYFAVPQRHRADGLAMYEAIELAPVVEFEADGYCQAFQCLKDVPQERRDSVFWSIYGSVPGQGFECIGDFGSRGAAIEVLRRLFGTLEPMPAS